MKVDPMLWLDIGAAQLIVLWWIMGREALKESLEPFTFATATIAAFTAMLLWPLLTIMFIVNTIKTIVGIR